MEGRDLLGPIKNLIKNLIKNPGSSEEHQQKIHGTRSIDTCFSNLHPFSKTSQIPSTVQQIPGSNPAEQEVEADQRIIWTSGDLWVQVLVCWSV